jgi:ribosomal protein S18 acetylase RimI-like enzyme
VTHDLRLRAATPADYDRIAAVIDDWWGRPVHHALPRLFLDHFHATSAVAESGGDLAGFLIGFLSPSLAGAAYIHFVGVHPGHRRGGLARELYQRFFALAAADGRAVVRAVTAPVNERSIAFHAALGFTVTGPVSGYDGPGDVKVRFERPLTADDAARAGAKLPRPPGKSRPSGRGVVKAPSSPATAPGSSRRRRPQGGHRRRAAARR